MQNMIFGDVPSLRRVVTVGNKVAPGTPGRIDDKPFVTITGSGDNPVKAHTQEGVEYVLRERGGVGLMDPEATVTFTGSFAFDVVGAKAATEQGTKVYLKDGASAGAGANVKTGTLTLTAEGGTLFGTVDFFRGETSATDTVVKIGL